MKMRQIINLLESAQSDDEIIALCRRHKITNYEIVGGKVNVYGCVLIGGSDDYPGSYRKLPINFGFIKGDFECSDNELTTMVGSPETVGGYFNCSHNKLTSLRGGPDRVHGIYRCTNNHLTDLVGSPKICGSHLLCQRNSLRTLNGVPNTIKGTLDVSDNPELSMEEIINGILGMYVLGDIYSGNRDLDRYIGTVLHGNGHQLPIGPRMEEFKQTLYQRYVK